ncbi:MAG: penicillin-binding transpeptidase domain-containing protein [Candidatus Paceibacterota bacterium]
MNTKLPPFTKAIFPPISFKHKKKSGPPDRLILLPLVIAVIFLILVSRLFQLNIVKGSYFRDLAENNRIREIPIPAKRGALIDRKGTVIVKSNPSLVRSYADAQAYSHAAGYIQTASPKDLKRDVCETPLDLGDAVGKTGAEAAFECVLRGKKGKELVEVDAAGKRLRTITVLPQKDGEDVQLSLDAALQKKTHEIIQNNAIDTSVEIDLTEKKIAIVASVPDTGEILILYSHPTFDAAAFTNSDQTAAAELLTAKDKPLFDRVTSGTYPPGSVFKPFVAAAALEEKIIDADFTYEDKGFVQAGPQKFGNWYFQKYGKVEGKIDVVRALARSTDTFFYTLGGKLGVPTIKSWARRFGLGEKTGITLAEETGLLPSKFWKKHTLDERWYLGDTYNLSIGQGYMLTTPLQINRAVSALANGGKLCVPKLLKIPHTASDNPFLTENQSVQCNDIGLRDTTLKLVREGMRQACESGGTGWPFFNFSVPVGCKTGTAENPAGAPHAWFSVFAPFDKPEIVLTVMVEEAGEGSNVAAPIAKEILKEYFKRNE